MSEMSEWILRVRPTIKLLVYFGGASLGRLGH